MIVFSYSLPTFDFLSSVSYVIDPEYKSWLSTQVLDGTGLGTNLNYFFLPSVSTQASYLKSEDFIFPSVKWGYKQYLWAWDAVKFKWMVCAAL